MADSAFILHDRSTVAELRAWLDAACEPADVIDAGFTATDEIAAVKFTRRGNTVRMEVFDDVEGVLCHGCGEYVGEGVDRLAEQAEGYNVTRSWCLACAAAGKPARANPDEHGVGWRQTE